MKTALCISGHLRTIFKTIKNINQHFKNIDVFISTYDTLGFDKKRGDGQTTSLKTKDIEKTLRNSLNIKELFIEPIKSFNKEKYTNKYDCVRDVTTVLGMYYKIFHANKLKQDYEELNNFKYDIVIRYRADIFMNKPFNLLQEPIVIPNIGFYGGYNDQLAYGQSNYMDKYCNLYNKIDEYYDQGMPIHPETMLKFHLDKENIIPKFQDIDYVLLRGNGRIHKNT